MLRKIGTKCLKVVEVVYYLLQYSNIIIFQLCGPPVKDRRRESLVEDRGMINGNVDI